MESKDEQTGGRFPYFRVWTCGAFRVERLTDTKRGVYQSVRVADWGGSTYPRLFLKALLCCPGRRVRREAVIEMLWPELDFEQAVQNLNTATTKLRRVLCWTKEHESLLVTKSDSSSYSLEGQQLLWVDADAAFSLLKDVERVGRTLSLALPLLEEAGEYLNNGAFLEEEDGEWLYGRRGALEEARYNGRLWLADAYEQQGMIGQAEMQLRALLLDDPTDEDVLCRLMLFLHRYDLVHKAWRTYQQIAVRLQREGLELSRETCALAERLHAERLSLDSHALRHASAVPQIMYERVKDQREIVVFSDPLQGDTHPLSEISHDSAIWFGWKQVQLMTLVQQWSGRASLSDELQAHLQHAFQTFHKEPFFSSPEMSQLSRRQVLISLATLALGFVASRQYERQPSLFAEEFLPKCAAGIVACQQLLKGSDIFQAEQILAQYLPVLEMLVRQPSRYQELAAQLTLQCDNLLRITASHRLQWNESERHSQHALQYSHLVKNPNIRIVTLIGLASDYFNCVRPAEALYGYQQALPLLRQVSPLLQSNFYVKRAAAHAQQGKIQQAQADLKQARKTFPDAPEKDAGFLHADFGQSSFFLWEGLTDLELARYKLVDPQEAWKALTRIEQLSTTAIMSERNRIEIINYQTRAAIYSGQMDIFCAYVQKGIEGAKKLGSARRRQEAIENYQLAREQWPSEVKVRDMAELLIEK